MKVALTGAHGVGKTTILNKLKEKLPQYIVQLESPTRNAVQSSNQLNFGTTIKTQKLVMAKYLEVIKNAPKDYISPRCLVDVLAYTVYFKGGDSGITEPFVQEQIKLLEIHKKDFDLYFYIPIEFDLQDKGEFREGQENKDYQKGIDQIITKYLWWFDIPFVTVTGNIYNRVNKIVDTIKKGEETCPQDIPQQ